ncbi:uncharacterized protein LOC115631841 [Scaptodrosophila lebanonensis]|uniref:Uncharacterized protein LOC115631841 n=1 Tax=Drosophila lebanonensis TaxID=7225 RepID=A0A6J2U881_DROLE|nr:uncharacterized protein LOC115631841 [Scaptodrosophila lebanonensis]
MAKKIPNVDVPRDPAQFMMLKKEINRDTVEISQNFWKEFRSMRQNMNRRLIVESNQRQEIGTLVRTADEEAHQQAEALSRTISTYGMNSDGNPLLGSPRGTNKQTHIQRTPEVILQLSNSLDQTNAADALLPAPNQESPKGTHMRMDEDRRSASPSYSRFNSQAQSMANPSILSTASNQIPKAPPTSRVTLVSGNLSKGTNASKQQITRR